MGRYIVILVLVLIPLFGIGKATEEIVKGMVPHGVVAQKTGDDYVVKTKSGTKVMIEFDRSGKLDEASGLNLDRGDIFEPGDGLMTLGSVAQMIKKMTPFTPSLWKLEKDSQIGWFYELTSVTEDEPVSFLINAKTAKLIKPNP